jgi:hypothetical protein
MRLIGKTCALGNYREIAMRLIDPKDFTGKARVRMLAACVAGKAPRSVGEVVELSSYEAYELIAGGLAEPFVPAPAFESLK